MDQRERTIPCLWLDDEVSLHSKLLQTRPFALEHIDESQGAHPRRPESLQDLGVLAPSIHKDVQPSPAINLHGF